MLALRRVPKEKQRIVDIGYQHCHSHWFDRDVSMCRCSISGVITLSLHQTSILSFMRERSIVDPTPG